MRYARAALVSIALLGSFSTAMADTIPLSTGSTTGWTGSVALSSSGGAIVPALGTPGVWQAAFEFALPSDATNVALTLTGFAVDDKGVVHLNGTEITDAVIFGVTGAGPTDVTSPFNIGGTNTLTVFVNNTGVADPAAQPTNDGGPTAFILFGEVTFDRASVSVPEPATLVLLGLSVLGLAAARRRKSS